VRVEIVWRPSNAVLVQSPVFADNTVNFGNVRGEVNYANDITPINPPAAGVQAPPTNALGINPTFPGDPPDLVNGPAPVPLKYYNTNLVQGKRNQLDANGQPVLDGGSRGFYIGQPRDDARPAPDAAEGNLRRGGQPHHLKGDNDVSDTIPLPPLPQGAPGYSLPASPSAPGDREPPSAGVANPFVNAASPGASVAVVSDLQVPTTPVIIQQSSYEEYSVSKVVYQRTGLAVNPVMGPPGTPGDVVRVEAPAGKMYFRWVSKRRGDLPIIPSSDLQDGNAVLVETWVSAVVPGYLLDGMKCHAVEGLYIYELRAPYKETDAILIGALPYSSEPASANVLPPGNFSKTIIGPNTPPAGAPADKVAF
jgi:hypothetical protein